MKSIRHKLLFQIGSLMLLIILLLYLANTFLLEKFYTEMAKNDLTNVYDTVNNLNESEYTQETLYQLSIQNRNYVDIVIVNNDDNEAFTPGAPGFSENTLPQPRELKQPPMNSNDILEIEEINDDSQFVWYHEKTLNMTFLMYDSILDNGFTIHLRIPLSSIEQNIQILNQYILVIGAIIFIIAMVAANFISGHFTKPILNIFNTTNSIKHMDFSKTCEVTTNDEIGRLAENINSMSYSLKENIDDLALSNEQLKEEVDERLKIDEQRKALLNHVSHELKTPLSLVQGYSEGLKLNLHKNKEKTDFYCEVIIDEAKKMDLLVSQLLDINHIQFGDFPLHKETTQAKDFLSYISRKYQELFQQNNIEFTHNIDLLDNELNLSLDALRSEQVLTNLLNNALAYVDDQKQISLRTSTIMNKEHGHLRVTVSNSFPALPDEELEKLWNSFYKIDKARTRDNGGYGLGLSIIKAIQETDHNEFGVDQADGFIHFWVDFDIK